MSPELRELMVDMGAITGVAASLRAASEITRAMIGLRDAALLQGKVIELQQVILAAQSDLFELNERIRQLEEEKAKLEAWKAERDRYQLTDFGGNTFAYELKADKAQGDPIHRLCPICFDSGNKAILQFSHRDSSSGQDRYDCFRCKAMYFFGINRPTRF
jgi:hypothetical protein